MNASTFQFFDFESARLPTVAWLETAIYGEIIEDTHKVEALEYLYQQIRAIALSQEGSLGLIKQIADGYDGKP